MELLITVFLVIVPVNGRILLQGTNITVCSCSVRHGTDSALWEWKDTRSIFHCSSKCNKDSSCELFMYSQTTMVCKASAPMLTGEEGSIKWYKCDCALQNYSTIVEDPISTTNTQVSTYTTVTTISTSLSTTGEPSTTTSSQMTSQKTDAPSTKDLAAEKRKKEAKRKREEKRKKMIQEFKKKLAEKARKREYEQYMQEQRRLYQQQQYKRQQQQQRWQNQQYNRRSNPEASGWKRGYTRYMITVYTSYEMMAGTGSYVQLYVKGSKGRYFWFELDKGAVGFEMGSIENFHFDKHVNIEPLTVIGLKVTSSGMAPGWLLQGIKVSVKMYTGRNFQITPYDIRYDQWIPSKDSSGWYGDGKVKNIKLQFREKRTYYE